MNGKSLALGLITLCIGSALADLPDFKSDPAKQAVEEYRTAIKAANAEFLAKLDAARAAALAAGDLDEAQAIVEAKALAEQHQGDDLFDRFLEGRRRFVGTRWRQNDGSSNTFSDGGENWAVVDGRTVAMYAKTSGNVYIWFFDEKLENAEIRRWLPDTKFKQKTAKRVH